MFVLSLGTRTLAMSLVQISQAIIRNFYCSEFRLKMLQNQLLRMESNYWKLSSLQQDYNLYQVMEKEGLR